MRRTKPKKLELRQRKIDRVDPIEELRQLKETELRRIQGGNQLWIGDGGGNCC